MIEAISCCVSADAPYLRFAEEAWEEQALAPAAGGAALCFSGEVQFEAEGFVSA